ncbi:YfiT family bacillithiol transferase [Robertmurraya korlensis]|uniref:YfiT family bacillithiol transferase n=1 Tax=Robertmurraya korlensis TaxID=519977 RepID=UPI000824467A|nr:bacillithiol transferase BstA [Robertmurraya korlensis]
MDARYPIGTFQLEGDIDRTLMNHWIEEIASLPKKLREAVTDLTDEQLDTPYREGGWTIRQVVHHIADSHMNAYIRFKLALTEDSPVIKPYEEARWAELEDSKLPVDVSLMLIESVHIRLIVLLKALNEDERKRTFVHPESGVVSLEKNIGLYAWHGNHHLAHITNAKL